METPTNRKKWATVDASQTFRSHWSPFVGTPSKARPHVYTPDKVVIQEAPEPEQAVAEQLPLLEGPPRDANVLLTILDRKNDYRAYIAEDGECINNRGETIGFLNLEDGEAGSTDMKFLGYIKEGTMDDERFIYDNLDEIMAKVNTGRSMIMAGGTTIAELDGAGAVSGHMGTYLGQFEGFGYRNMETVALYLILIDTGMLNEIEG